MTDVEVPEDAGIKVAIIGETPEVTEMDGMPERDDAVSILTLS